MASLDWIGKKAVINHHNEVPFHLLKEESSLSVGDPESGNLLVQGDNLLALKALLPYYAGQVNCIYIDPPYNTGNEKWVYDDNVNNPEIKKWLGKVVGGETEDLSRHDKWICMMYPRLNLLKQFLNEDGIIFVSIDDNEAFYLKFLLDEIFGPNNFVQAIIWKNKYGPGAMTSGFGNVHEYIFCYSKYPIKSIEAPLGDEEIKKYKFKDDNYSRRGGYITQPLATRSKDDRPNLVYPIVHKGEEIWPDKQWIWAKERMLAALKNNEVVLRKSKENKWSVRFKQYLKDETGEMRKAKPISIMNGPFNQDGTWEIEKIFDSKIFPNPKPVTLIKYLFSMVVNDSKNKDGIFLDSFAGSATSGHAVLEMNKEDGGNRKFILAEMDSKICQEITAKRLKKVIEGYKYKGEKEIGIGGGFHYCKLGIPCFDEKGRINPEVKFSELARHVFFAETGVAISKRVKTDSPLVGIHKDIAIYLLYNGILKDKTPHGGNVLTRDVLSGLPKHDGSKIIYGTACRLGKTFLKQQNVTFRQIPYEIRVK